ncbi:MAG: hypothetical protein K6G15_08775, partial [Desulfovibrio sp.]|nr:hypothetical protein [Desulfovibrio sp.]
MIDLTNYYCAFSHSNGTYLRYFKLNADGKIIDIDTEGHDNERYWEIKDEQLILYNNRSIRTSIFLFNSRLTNY